MKCPFCKGDGYIEQSKAKKNLAKLREEVAVSLYIAGFSYREIGRMLGIAHNSVYRYVKKNTK